LWYNCCITIEEDAMTKRKDYAGNKYGRLTAKEFSHSENGTTFWVFVCECGTEVTRRVNNVTSGNTTSCGCYKTEVMSEYDRTTHGLYYTPFWHCFHGARHRCENTNDTDYKDYGGRGIKFCWESLEEFAGDLQDTYFTGATLERIDVDGNYCKENCKWETRKKQARNRRKTKSNTSGVTGVGFNAEDNRWFAHWRSLDGKHESKSFSARKYGNNVAFELACAARTHAIEKLNSDGAGYSEKHGL